MNTNIMCIAINYSSVEWRRDSGHCGVRVCGILGGADSYGRTDSSTRQVKIQQRVSESGIVGSIMSLRFRKSDRLITSYPNELLKLFYPSFYMCMAL